MLGGPQGLTGTVAGQSNDNFFDVWDRWIADTPRMPAKSELPFVGGWAFLLGYEAARWVEPTLQLPDSPFELPDAVAIRCHGAILHDRLHDHWYAVSDRSAAALESLRQLAASAPIESALAEPPVSAESVREETPQRYRDSLKMIREWLHAGDTFQINLSRRWDACFSPDARPEQLFRQLRQHNPAPFAALFRWAGGAVISSSPERLLKLEDGYADTRPIAGTRKRGLSTDEDAALRQALVGNLKERAEHVMLIDLERNDLGRICEPGTVEVNELMVLESYAHVHHIVSNVRGRLASNIGPASALKAVFPGGTITGCPKVRSMQIIAELEGEGRGPYTGSLGYLSRDGRLDSNILIRTLVWRDGGEVSLRAGAGIVADSRSDAETDETRAKARGLLLALGQTP